MFNRKHKNSNYKLGYSKKKKTKEKHTLLKAKERKKSFDNNKATNAADVRKAIIYLRYVGHHPEL